MHRLATLDDLNQIQSIERAAGEIFRSLGMDSVADDDPISKADFARFAIAGRAWVALDGDESPIAYLLLERLGNLVHIEQITVHPSASRQGIGARLLDAAADWCTDTGGSALTLTTFRDIPWNAPYYERLGFAALEPAQWGPELSRKVERESAAGLARWPRVVMRRELTP